MKRLVKRLACLPVLGLLWSAAPVFAQGTDNALEWDFGARTSVALDYKLVKGLHLGLEYQLRLEDKFARIDRHQATLGLDYKLTDWLKLGAGYTFFYRQGSKAWNTRHRFYFDATFGLRAGAWRFTLKEQLRLTHKTEADLNRWQETRNPLMLKSRIKAQYKGWPRWSPYAFAEVRNVFNDPSCKAVWNASTASYSDYEFLGYNAAYVNRLRGALGVEWRITRQHGLDFYAMLDYCYDKDIDTNAAGTRLKSLTWDQSMMGILGIAYSFSF